MKMTGLIGGISWVSTIDYYRYINEGINEQLGGNNFASCIIYSFNYNDIISHSNSGDFEGTYKLLLAACGHLKNSGATAIVLCANTMHMHAERLQESVGLPVIHIAEATAAAIQAKKLKKVGLLGTKFTMEQAFFKEKLAAVGIEAIVPVAADRDFIHHTIFEELGKGIVLEATRARYAAIIADLASQGAQGVVLGCTEIPLVVSQGDVAIPVFDTTLIHSKATVAYMLG